AFDLSVDLEQVELGNELLLGFVDPQSSGAGFDTLRFRAAKEGVEFLDITFNDIIEATAYFDDQLLTFSDLRSGVEDGALNLSFIFETEVSDFDDMFRTDFIASARVVPLPASGWFFLAAVAACAAWTRKIRVPR